MAIPKEIVAELPLINLTYWNSWSTGLPKDALLFACDIRQSQATDSKNPLMSVAEVRVQGFAYTIYLRQEISECIGMTADLYLGDMEMTRSEPEPGECTECRDAIANYFDALERSYLESVGQDDCSPRPFVDIPVRQPAILSWRDAFDDDGRFAPKAYGMSYDLNDAFMFAEDAVREYGGEIDESVEEAKDELARVLAKAVNEKGMRAEDVARGWREGSGPTASAVIQRWSSDMLDGQDG